MSDTKKFIDWVFTIPKTRFKIGLTHDVVDNYKNEPYLERYILWFGGTIRLHKFYRSDDDRALHDHPWRFITFPFSTYQEYQERPGEPNVLVDVTRFRFHYRPAQHKHRVVVSKPSWTFIITGMHIREWGFWPTSGWVHWSKF